MMAVGVCVCVCVYVCVCVCVCTCAYSVYLFVTPLHCSLLGSSVHGIFQSRILVGVAISYFKGSSRLRDLTCISVSPALAGRFFTTSTS